MRERGRYSDGAFGWEVRFARAARTARLDELRQRAGWSATTSSTPPRWRCSPPASACRRGWSSAPGCRPTGWSRARTSSPGSSCASPTGRGELPRSSYMSFRPPKQSDPPNDPVVASEPEPEPEHIPDPQPSPAPDPQPDDDSPDQQQSLERLPVVVAPAAAPRRGRRRPRDQAGAPGPAPPGGSGLAPLCRRLAGAGRPGPRPRVRRALAQVPARPGGRVRRRRGDRTGTRGR